LAIDPNTQDGEYRITHTGAHAHARTHTHVRAGELKNGGLALEPTTTAASRGERQ
jgi:hypothetical protein